jgi:hypothetical protein
LALQVWRIAKGDRALLNKHGLGNWAFRQANRFVAFYIPCTDATPTTDGVLERIATSLASVQARSDEKLVDRTTRRAISVKIFTSETTKKYSTAVKDVASLHPEDRVTSLATTLTETTSSPVLIVLDELDRVQDTSGLASFLKANSSKMLKFVLVGISQNLGELIKDHKSLERIAIPVQVKAMAIAELEAIITSVVRALHRDGINIRFSTDAKSILAAIAGGFPWFVHVIGQEALVNIGTNEQSVVETTDVTRAVVALTKNRFAQQFNDLYERAVKNSEPRELVLRTFAEFNERDIPVADAYRILRQWLGVDRPSGYRGHLMDASHGRVLIVPHHKERGVVRFADEMFKVYIRLRPSLYDEVSAQVRRAFRDDKIFMHERRLAKGSREQTERVEEDESAGGRRRDQNYDLIENLYRHVKSDRLDRSRRP